MAITLTALSWIYEAHAMLGMDPMQQAINMYWAQKQKFIKLLEAQGMLGAEDFVQKLKDELNDMLQQQSEFGDIADSLMDSTEKAVDDLLSQVNSGTKDNYKTAIDNAKFYWKDKTVTHTTHDEIARLGDRWKEEMNQELFGGENGEALLNRVDEILKSKGININPNSTDIAGAVLGYARRFSLTKLSTRYAGAQSTDLHKQRYTSTIKGYVAEQMWDVVFKRVLQKYAQQLTVLQTQPFSEQGKETIVDILIGSVDDLKNIKDATGLNAFLDSLHANILEQHEFPIYYPGLEDTFKMNTFGMQSKSWQLPDNTVASKIKNNQSNLWFGSHADLIPDGTDAYIWHAGLYMVMSHLLEVIGPANVFFAAGHEMMWTADLLSKLKEMDYILAFRLSMTEKNKETGRRQKREVPKITSGTVYALPLDDSNLGAYEK